ncbi:conserved hypothetical protein [Histoplasma capsulatum H143]|uniref:Uncharacterized protein n=1 Tax=Ajellomyces capsulatus (strain H143) TaxID=544712 RepID=C6HQW3_AJECH|nr:conserved hypothetical protein [Histoplasma capsulatum H143]
MSNPSICRSWLPPQPPRLCRYASSCLHPNTQRVSLAQLLFHVRRSKARREPSASQLLRFAITGTLKKPNDGYYAKDFEEYMLEAFSKPHLPETWTIFNTEPSKIRRLTKNAPLVDRYDPKDFKDNIELPTLQAVCEKYIVSPRVAREILMNHQGIVASFESCAKREGSAKVLATLNALVARFALLKVQVPKGLLILGMRFASRQFSAPTLQSYIQSYVTGGYGPIPGRQAAKILRNLYQACRSLYPAAWDYRRPRRLLNIWPTVQDRLKNSRWVSRVYCAEQLSRMRLNDILPTRVWAELLKQDNSEGLQKIVSSQTVNGIMHSTLTSIENRLGITWNHVDGGRHVKTSDMDPLWDHWPVDAVLPSLDPDASSTGSSGCLQRLLEEIKLYGSSKSTTELARVANLLHDFEGCEIPLGFRKGKHDKTLEFAWFPHCCPIEFSNNAPPSRYNINGPQSPSSLGLIRAFHGFHGKTIRLSKWNLYLMQLGYLCERSRGFAESGINGTTGDSEKWTATGHIICWDRLNHHLMILFLGRGLGVIDPGFYPEKPHPYLPSVANLTSKPWNNFQAEFSENSGFLLPLRIRYWLDVDPAAYLVP